MGRRASTPTCAMRRAVALCVCVCVCVCVQHPFIHRFCSYCVLIIILKNNIKKVVIIIIQSITIQGNINNKHQIKGIGAINITIIIIDT